MVKITIDGMPGRTESIVFDDVLEFALAGSFVLSPKIIVPYFGLNLVHDKLHLVGLCEMAKESVRTCQPSPPTA